jgi:hypothetical protein
MSLIEALIPTGLVLLVMQSPLVICAGWFAPIIGAKRWLWIGLTAIPWLGLLFGYVLIFRAFGNLLDALERQNQLKSAQHLEKRLSPSSFSSFRLEPETHMARTAALS